MIWKESTLVPINQNKFFLKKLYTFSFQKHKIKLNFPHKFEIGIQVENLTSSKDNCLERSLSIK